MRGLLRPVAAARALQVGVVPHDDVVVVRITVPHALIRFPRGIAFLLRRR